MSEALRLADLLVSSPQYSGTTIWQAAAELRRLHALNAELVEALELVLDRLVDRNETDEAAVAARAALAKVEASNE